MSYRAPSTKLAAIHQDRSPVPGSPRHSALEAAGIATVSLAAKSAKHAVRVGTMRGMEGLEFQTVAVFGMADGAVSTVRRV